MEAAPEGGLHFSKIRWNRHFGTNDLCEIAIFQVIKVYFQGGMAARRCVKNILQVHEGIITCVKISHLMYALNELESCNFYNGCIEFFSRTALIISPHSFDFRDAEIKVKKRRFDRKKRPLCFLKI